MLNEKVKRTIKKSLVTNWELANALNISEMSLYRMFRKELPEEEQNKLCDMIVQIDKNRERD